MTNLSTNSLATGCWRGHSCFIVGGGPSLRGFNFDLLNGWLTIGVNRAFEFFSPTILLAIDARFYQWVLDGKYGREAENKLACYKGFKVGIRISEPHIPGILEIKSLGASGPIVPIEQGIYHGNNSGYSAVALALALGADPVYIMGIDLRYDGKQTHFHSGHPELTPEKELFNKCIKPFINLSTTKEGERVKLVNTQWPEKSFSKLAGYFNQVSFEASKTTVITPTGDRPLAFALCQKWMAAQTVKPDQWLIIDDGKIPMGIKYRSYFPSFAKYIRRKPKADDPKHTLVVNLKKALPSIAGNKIIIWEDDEYYAPDYIERMARELSNHEVVGIKRAKYYHLPTGGYLQIGNGSHASLAQTGFCNSFIPELETLWDGDMSLDMRIWKKADGRGYLYDDTVSSLYLGIKGLPGRPGIGQGHNPNLYRGYSMDTLDRAKLKTWIPKDYQIYMDILNGKLTSENYDSYFSTAALPITGITVCWNTKDLIERAYNSIRKFYPDMPIIIIDGSDPGDPCAAYVRGLASDITTIIQPGYNVGHGRGMCMGIEKAATPYALIFDSDIELLEPCLPAMLAMMEADTFGVGYLEDIGYDGFRYKIHPHPEGPLPCIHPYWQLINIENYKKFHPYVHHGMPVYLTMLDIHKKGLSSKILKQFPGLSNEHCQGSDVSRFVRHHSNGTGGMRIARGLPHIEGRWVENRGQV